MITYCLHFQSWRVNASDLVRERMGADEADRLSDPALPRDALHHQVYKRLATIIMTGGLEPGAVVTLRSLADAVGTSEMPVRDAVRRLIAERALEFRPGRRFGVPTLSAAQYREILHVRMLLEEEAAKLAAERISAAELGVLKAIQAELLDAGKGGHDRRTLWSINRRFHFTIYAAARSTLLASMIETLWLQIGPLFNHLSVDMGQRDAAGHHARILQAIEHRDGPRAGEAVRADLESAATLILAELHRLETEPQSRSA
jgi:DNA-binding GntR family transcriptional regulator